LLPINVGLSYIYISQGSVVTQLKCGGILNNHFIANCLQNMPVKKIWKIHLCLLLSNGIRTSVVRASTVAF